MHIYLENSLWMFFIWFSKGSVNPKISRWDGEQEERAGKR